MSSTSVNNKQTKNNHHNIYNSNGSPCKRKSNTNINNSNNGVSHHSELNRKVAFSVRRSKPIRSKTIIDNMMANGDNNLKQHQHHHKDTSVNHHEIPQISTYSLGSIELKKKPCGAKKRKIKIEFIEDKTKRNVTFSKRKTGLLKKAFELSAMTESQILALVVSETGNVFSYATDDLLPLLNEEEFRTAIKACLESPATATATATTTLQNKTNSLKSSVTSCLRKKNKRESESDTDYIDHEVNEGEESYMSLSDTDSN